MSFSCNPGVFPLGIGRVFFSTGWQTASAFYEGVEKFLFMKRGGFWIMRGANPGEFLFYGLADRERVGC